MTFLEKIKDSIATRAAEAIAASLTVLLTWVVYQIAPVILPAIEAAVSKQILLTCLVTSLVLNFIFLLVVWGTSKKEPFRLKYGIYWDKDKNAHCPSCQKPIATYGEYAAGKGYYCKPCGKVFPLADASGNDIEPAKVLSEL